MNNALRQSAAHVFVDSVTHPVLSKDDQHHLERVLRLRDGEMVTCSDGNGAWAVCQWVHKSLNVHGEVLFQNRPEPLLSMAIAPVKGDRTDLVIEKLVEIGIDRIIVLSPLDRSVVRWAPDKVSRIFERYSRIIRAAAMQSRRVYLPELLGPLSLQSVIENGAVLAEPGGSAAPDTFTTLIIGPEGGFSPDELGRATATYDLGPSILRAETAAMVGAARMVAHWRR